jgi:hypothetical protein
MAWIIVAALLGITSRTVLPFLQTLKESPETKFDRKFLVPAVVSVIISLVFAPFVLLSVPLDAAPTLQGMLITFAAAWGVTDVGRQGQKLISG